MIGAHAGLTGAGAWQADEYYNFALLRHLGGWFLWGRVLHWSPRPVSELALAGYAWAVDRLRRPLIGPALLGCWLVLAVALAAGWWRRGMRWAEAVVPLSLFALMLLGHPVSEMFYWPMAAAPYLLCLAGLAFVTLRGVRGGLGGWAGRLSAAAALAVAAGCAELGGVLALCLCPVLMALEPKGAGRVWRVACWAMPLAAGAAVVWLVDSGRVANMADAPGLGNDFFHKVLPSSRAAVTEFGRQLTGGAGLSLALAFGGFTVWLGEAGRPAGRAHLLALAGALLGTVYVSIMAAYYQFGRLCCERHATFRQCLLLLALLALAAWLASRLGPRAGQGWLGPALLIGAMAVVLPGRARDLARDYRAEGAIVAAREASWRSGRAASGAMVVQLPPLGRVVSPRYWIAPGQYEAMGGQPWFVTGLMLFFDHTEMKVVLPPPRPGR